MAFELWKEILEYGRWAPSPHNIQPWRFKLETEDRLTLLYDPQRLLPGTDPTGRFCTVGFGILCEFLDVAAAPRGRVVQTEYLTRQLDVTQKELQPFARLTLLPRTRPEALDRQLILERRTSRLPYDDLPVAEQVLAELATMADAYCNKFEFSTDPQEVAWVIQLNADTLFFDMSDPVARNELGSWIRFSEQEARRRADGLAAYTMGFPALLAKLFVRHHWLFHLPVIYDLTRAIYKHSMKGTRTVAWLSGAFDQPEDWDRAGRMLARLWLAMTRQGIYLQPFGSIITNHTARARMTAHFANAHREHDLWLLVRLGHSQVPPQAQRLTLEQLLVN